MDLFKKTPTLSFAEPLQIKQKATIWGQRKYSQEFVFPIFWRELFGVTSYLGGCAKGAEKASCGETAVQKGVFGESVSSLPP